MTSTVSDSPIATQSRVCFLPLCPFTICVTDDARCHKQEKFALHEVVRGTQTRKVTLIRLTPTLITPISLDSTLSIRCCSPSFSSGLVPA